MANLEQTKILKEKIEKLGGNLVAVSKKFSSEEVREVQGLGVKDFGENYVSEALEKIEILKNLDLRWHFIGRVQSGNLNKILNKFYLIQSLYKFDHIRKINERSEKKQRILLQIQHEKDTRDFGLKENELVDLIEKTSTLDKIDLAGLMFMPPPDLEGVELDKAFEWAEEIFKKLKNKMSESNSWGTLSMGMSGDYEKALKAGSTHVRIGTAIFGKRI